MSKSEFVTGLDAVQSEVNSLLIPLGFRKKGRTHNRLTKGGLTHVVNFQREKYVEQRRIFPQFWKKTYGKFAINLGVLLPCVYQAECPSSSTEFFQEYDCTIRRRLSPIAFSDKWFEITDDTSDLAKTIVDLFQRCGLMFFDQFQTYEDVLSYYQKHNKLPFQNPDRASLEAALIAHHLGNAELARSLFGKAYAANHKGFQDHVAKLTKLVGYTLK
ncbi:MAG: DUF4304 domain-containing protein [Verrucomicrobiales bacterium]|nr:DUF4304 domain-containing protein [Verrucomicrobiales bacterium]